MKSSNEAAAGPSALLVVLPVALVALFLSGCAEEAPLATTTTGIVMTMDDTDDADDMDDMEHTEDGHEHSEDGREWEGTPPVLELRIDDGPDGPIAVLEASGFSFIDPSTDEHVPGLGHTHVFVDGQLQEMSYNAAVPLGELAPGSHHIEVTLASGDHADFLIDGEVLGASTMFEVAGDVAAADLLVSVDFTGGAVEVPDDRFEVARHGFVEITITSDVADEVHVHGYNLTRAFDAGTTTVRFTAGIPGVFEVELEDSGHALFELTVTP